MTTLMVNHVKFTIVFSFQADKLVLAHTFSHSIYPFPKKIHLGDGDVKGCMWPIWPIIEKKNVHYEV